MKKVQTYSPAGASSQHATSRTKKTVKQPALTYFISIELHAPEHQAVSERGERNQDRQYYQEKGNAHNKIFYKDKFY